MSGAAGSESAATGSRGFPLLDSLRAIAALSVFGYHIAATRHDLASALGPYLAQLNIGVSIFFVISGFLLYRPFARARRDGRPFPSIRRYALRRAARIVPAYWIALPIVALWIGAHDVFTPSGVVTYFGFAQAYRQHTFIGGIGQAWTLCIEVAFYASLPLLALAMSRRRPSTPRNFITGELTLCAALFAGSVAWQLFVIHRRPGTPSAPLLLALPGWLDLFSLGMALAVLGLRHQPARTGPLSRVLTRAPWSAWLLAGGLYVAVAKPGFLGARADVLLIGTHELKGLVAVALLAPAVIGAEGRDRFRRALGSPALRYVGLVSYGVYLWHYAIVVKLSDAGLAATVGETGFVVVTLALALAAGSLSYRLVERPALAFAHRR